MYLQSKDISFGYSSSKIILSDINFSLDKGKTLAIVGASGCGKSTLLRIISGLLPEYSNPYNVLNGKITINEKSPKEILKENILSFMFQEPTLLPNLNVWKNVDFPLKIKGSSNREKVNDILTVVGLKDYTNFYPSELSGGMKTRVALARSFITSPQLLLLDEPFSALDISWRSNLYLELEKLKENNNTTIVLVTHDVQEAILLADEIMVLNKNGREENYYKIDSSYNGRKRITNSSDYLKEIYESYLIPIQEDIVKGQKL